LLPGFWFATGGPYGALGALLIMALMLGQVRRADAERAAES
jgi:hypothetical protein